MRFGKCLEKKKSWIIDEKRGAHQGGNDRGRFDKIGEKIGKIQGYLECKLTKREKRKKGGVLSAKISF